MTKQELGWLEWAAKYYSKKYGLDYRDIMNEAYLKIEAKDKRNKQYIFTLTFRAAHELLRKENRQQRIRERLESRLIKRNTED